MAENVKLTGNKLIAEFMGFEYIPHLPQAIYKPGWWKKDVTFSTQQREPHLRKLGKSNFLCRRHPELRYCNEWNWLMPVVEKIEGLEGPDDLNGDNYWCMILGKGINIESPHPNKDIISCASEGKNLTKIQSVYLGVVEFIKWYNKNK